MLDLTEGAWQWQLSASIHYVFHPEDACPDSEKGRLVCGRLVCSESCTGDEWELGRFYIDIAKSNGQVES